ncbi:MAG: hypothetical protein RIF32_05990 [Leptospirales bacterium]|jgi:hypothetical protein
MTKNEDSWRSFESYLREEGPPPPGLAQRMHRLDSEDLPPELDSRVLAQIRSETASGGSRPIPAPANRLKTVGRIAAALVLVGVGAWLGVRAWSWGNALPVTVVATVGAMTVDGRSFAQANAAPSEGLSTGSEVVLESGALLYLEYAPGFLLRVVGPAKFFPRSSGIELRHGALALLASRRDSERSGESAPVSDDFDQVHARFRLQTTRAEYRLTGTCFELRSYGDPNPENGAPNSRGEELLVLEGAVAVDIDGEEAATVGGGEGLRLPAGLASEGDGGLNEPGIFTLQEYDREGLGATRESLHRYIAAPDAPPGLSVEELRALYGSVMRFQLRDGRTLVGFMLQTPDGDFIHTGDGRIRINPAEVLSFVLVD